MELICETQSTQAEAAEVDLMSLPPATRIETQSAPSLVEPQTAAFELKSPAPDSVDLNPETLSSQSLAGAAAVDVTAFNDTQTSQAGTAAVPPPATRIEAQSAPSLVKPQTAAFELKSPAPDSEPETLSSQSLAGAVAVDLSSSPTAFNDTQSPQAGAAAVPPPATGIETLSSPSLVKSQTAAIVLKSPAPDSVAIHSIQALAETTKVDLSPETHDQSSQSLAGAVAVDLSSSPTVFSNTQSSQAGAAAVPPPATRIETQSSPSLVEPQTAAVESKSPAPETHSIQSLAEAAKIDISVPIKSTNTDHTKEKRGHKRKRAENIVPPRVSSKRVRKKPDFLF